MPAGCSRQGCPANHANNFSTCSRRKNVLLSLRTIDAAEGLDKTEAAVPVQLPIAGISAMLQEICKETMTINIIAKHVHPHF